MSTEPSQPDWFRENLAAYIAGGLSNLERERIEQFARSDDAARTELETLMALDLSLHRAAGVESIVAGVEERVIAALDSSRRWSIHPIVRRAALTTAACVILGTFGYLGSQQGETSGMWGWMSSEKLDSATDVAAIGRAIDGYLADFERYDPSRTDQGRYTSTGMIQVQKYSPSKITSGAEGAGSTELRSHQMADAKALMHGLSNDFSTVSDARTNGTIFIQKEESGRQFPLLSSTIDADGDGIADKDLYKLPVGNSNGVTYYGAAPIQADNGKFTGGWEGRLSSAAGTRNADGSSLGLNGAGTYSGGTMVTGGTLEKTKEYKVSDLATAVPDFKDAPNFTLGREKDRDGKSTLALYFDPVTRGSTIRNGVQTTANFEVPSKQDSQKTLYPYDPSSSMTPVKSLEMVRTQTELDRSAKQAQLDEMTATAKLIQEPTLDLTGNQRALTSVSVPDGGTLKLGGQTLSGETDSEKSATSNSVLQNKNSATPTAHEVEMLRRGEAAVNSATKLVQMNFDLKGAQDSKTTVQEILQRQVDQLRTQAETLPVSKLDLNKTVAVLDRDPQAPAQPPVTQPAAIDSPKIIRTGELAFEVDRFDSAAAVIGKIVSDERGFVATTSSDKLANGKVRGAVVVRIPPDHLDTFVLQLRALGDLKSQRIGSQDVGKEYYDLDGELRADRAMEERLLDLIKNGKGEIKDLLAAEKELAEWRGKIEKILGQMKYYDNQIAMSTLTITLMERDIQTAAATVEQETINAGVEADDVEKARADALAMLADAKARIVSADLKKLDAGQMASTIVADIPSGGSGPVIDRIKQLGKVARLEATKSTTTDPNNPATPTTRVEKRDSRLTLSLYNVANVAPRQTVHIELATTDVSAAYNTIVAKTIKSGGRVVQGGTAQGRSDRGRADARIEVPTTDADGFLADLKAMGEIITLGTSETNDNAGVTMSKRGYDLTIYSAQALPPRQSATFRIETGDVEQASAGLQAALLQAGGRVIRSDAQAEPAGISTAILTMELPLDQTPNAIAAVRNTGKVLAVSTSQNAEVPTGTLAKSRVDITFTTPGPITGETGGLLANLRHGLSLSARGLLLSMQFVVIGLCFVLPWVVAIAIGLKLWRRRKSKVATA